ncbi:RES family NAD+ phosphorylase [Mesorhizobium sp. CO1-1-8]|uniref:RES family NAD+ phosphorylase n=1 Tax=Mesorhizobium sp. CO1-1-8 TaxID=2876631 RepID=UPI001CD11E99|nr:RES family NAD+ phosphorylase [Mesorhizobium sp. CO1-1-8]MBZ9772318.1 RES family NAD+ phosphorylase [Mesorhizobium sp. CO1-1-8]
MPGLDPPSKFAAVALDTATVDAGAQFGRIFFTHFKDPLGFGKTPSRFSDPRRRAAANRFGVLYLGSSLKVCFVEAVLRDQGDARVDHLLLDENDLAVRSYGAIEVMRALSLVDLRGDGPLRMGIPSDVARGSLQSLARRWSIAIHDHPTQPDGIIYPSRLNGETNLAIYDRAILKLNAVTHKPLLKEFGLAPVLRDLKVGLQ